MPHAPAPLVFELFDSQRRLDGLADSNQEQYLRGYLGDLGTQVIVTERNYFDRDYLSEFAAFFGASARAYPNVCRRLHFLADGRVDRALFAKALDGDADAAGDPHIAACASTGSGQRDDELPTARRGACSGSRS